MYVSVIIYEALLFVTVKRSTNKTNLRVANDYDFIYRFKSIFPVIATLSPLNLLFN